MPETQHVEWKAAWQDGHLKLVCAFAAASVFFRADEHRSRMRRGSMPQATRRARRAKRARQIETWGRDIQRIFEVCKKAQTPHPILEHSGNGLWLGFPFSKAYLETIGSVESTSQNDKLGTKTALSRHQVAILRKCLAPSRITELLAIAERSDRTKFRHQVLQPLIQAELLQMTVPDKPTSSNQRYLTTEIGRSRVQQSD